MIHLCELTDVCLDHRYKNSSWTADCQTRLMQLTLINDLTSSPGFSSLSPSLTRGIMDAKPERRWKKEQLESIQPDGGDTGWYRGQPHQRVRQEEVSREWTFKIRSAVLRRVSVSEAHPTAAFVASAPRCWDGPRGAFTICRTYQQTVCFMWTESWSSFNLVLKSLRKLLCFSLVFLPGCASSDPHAFKSHFTF